MSTKLLEHSVTDHFGWWPRLKTHLGIFLLQEWMTNRTLLKSDEQSVPPWLILDTISDQITTFLHTKLKKIHRILVNFVEILFFTNHGIDHRSAASPGIVDHAPRPVQVADRVNHCRRHSTICWKPAAAWGGQGARRLLLLKLIIRYQVFYNVMGRCGAFGFNDLS